MTTNDHKSISPSRAVQSTGSIAARKRNQLEQFEATRKRSIEKLNHARAELVKAAAEAEGRERRRARNQQMADQKRLKFILGGLMLDYLRTSGQAAFFMRTQDLEKLKEKDQRLLHEVLMFTANTAAVGVSVIEADDPAIEMEVDVLL